MENSVTTSRPHRVEDFSPTPLIEIPVRWMMRAQKLGTQRGGEYLRRKLRTGNVGRKLRRYIRRNSEREGK